MPSTLQQRLLVPVIINTTIKNIAAKQFLSFHEQLK